MQNSGWAELLQQRGCGGRAGCSAGTQSPQGPQGEMSAGGLSPGRLMGHE